MPLSIQVVFPELLEKVIRCSRVSGLFCGLRTLLARMVSVDWVQIVDASTRLQVSIRFPQPRFMTVVPYSPSAVSHCPSIRGLRASILASHVPGTGHFLIAQRMTSIAPVISDLPPTGNSFITGVCRFVTAR